MHANLLHGLRVLALGDRIAVDTCCKLLGLAGAAVSKHETGRDEMELERAVLVADVIVASSDAGHAPAFEAARRIARRAGAIMVCDITGAGDSGPYSRSAHTDAEIQALTGLMDTTGFPTAAPMAIGLPYCEVSAGIYAAASIAAALVAWRRHGLLQDVDVSLYGAATNALTTFLPHVFAGKDPHRLGNRHSSAAPWNAYRTADGWILICTSTQDQWQRLSALIGGAAAHDDAYAKPRERVVNAEQLDVLIGRWTLAVSTAECLQLCAAADIPAGPVLTVEQLKDDPNVRHRGMIGADGKAGTPFKLRPWPARAATATAPRALPASRLPTDMDGPLAGMRVIEIGQYTTAPLVGKHLAALGAEVTKIEPPGGDPTRDWPHGQGDTSYFFALSNTDKVSVTIDLKTEEGKAKLREMLSTADVFVENLRPGAMERLGFGTEQLVKINPRLVYCAISGFGASSAYPGRPAFDTVIQAMGGFMDLTGAGGTPTKAGISGADILSGQVGLFVVVAALLRRDQTNIGASIDIAMQDVAVWATASRWSSPAQPERTVRCADGYLLLRSAAGIAPGEFDAQPRAEAMAICASRNIRAVPVYSVAEVIRDPHFTAHSLGLGLDRSGRFWPVLSPPYRYSFSPGPIGRVPAGTPA